MQLLSLTKKELERLRKTYQSYISTKITNALSVLLGENVDYTIGMPKEIEFSKVNELMPLNYADNVNMSAIYVKCYGDVSMGFLYYLNEKNGKKLAAKLLGKEKINRLSKLGISSLSETANILSASFIGGLNNATGYKMASSVPGFAMDTFRSIIEFPTVEIGMDSSSIIFCVAELISDGGFKINILLMQDPNEAKKILQSFN